MLCIHIMVVMSCIHIGTLLFFDYEAEGSTFLRNVDVYRQDYMTS